MTSETSLVIGMNALEPWPTSITPLFVSNRLGTPTHPYHFIVCDPRGERLPSSRIPARRWLPLATNDRVYVEVAGGFSSSLFEQGESRWQDGQMAAALREAVMRVRAGDMAMPLDWTQFVHYGT